MPNLSLYRKLLVVAISAILGRIFFCIFFSRALPMIVIVAITLVPGVLIGRSGIGRVLPVPCLILAGVDVHKATFGSAAGARVAHAVLRARLVALARVLAGVMVVVRSGHTRIEPW